MGASWRFAEALTKSEDSSTLNTSFIERMNLTIRRGSAYLSRRTLAHARLRRGFEEHLELLRCHFYNFVRPHGALKFGCEIRTPAMQAGLATRRLTFREVFLCQPPSPLVLVGIGAIACAGPSRVPTARVAVAHDPVRYQDLIASRRPRAVPPSPPQARGHPPSLERPPANRPWRTAALNWSG